MKKWENLYDVDRSRQFFDGDNNADNVDIIFDLLDSETRYYTFYYNTATDELSVVDSLDTDLVRFGFAVNMFSPEVLPRYQFLYPDNIFIAAIWKVDLDTARELISAGDIRFSSNGSGAFPQGKIEFATG